MVKQLVTKRRRLFFDIEVSGNLVWSWTVGHKVNIGAENIIKERAIICICYKWEEEKEVYGIYWDSKQNDKKLLQQFVEIAGQADELVGHNGDKFDLAWIRTRCLFHGIEMFPKYTTIDTLKVSRAKFRFNSNRLDYIAKFLGLGGKIKTEFNLWKDIVLSNSKPAMEKMIKYCKRDVTLLEKVYKLMGGHIEARTHYGVVFGQDRGSCPECGSNELTRHKTKVTATGLKKIQYQCKNCGKYSMKTDR
jgi:predicted RNA-binding Zn-ribbon protein involved in translation (DUF1610 family)